jgi:hypothetical protein
MDGSVPVVRPIAPTVPTGKSADDRSVHAAVHCATRFEGPLNDNDRSPSGCDGVGEFLRDGRRVADENANRQIVRVARLLICEPNVDPGNNVKARQKWFEGPSSASISGEAGIANPPVMF